MKPYSDFKLLRITGSTAIILNGNRVLLVKRVRLPLLWNAGAWTFVAGKKEKGENHEQTAYREVLEETGLRKSDLVLLRRCGKAVKFVAKNRIRYVDKLFIFRSKTRKVKLNFEHTAYRWASLSDIKNQREYTNLFVDKKSIERAIRSAMHVKKLAKR
jgi:8-oxo-dGTP pyrophosphatase MutT (NUDIX family)